MEGEGFGSKGVLSGSADWAASREGGESSVENGEDSEGVLGARGGAVGENGDTAILDDTVAH